MGGATGGSVDDDVYLPPGLSVVNLSGEGKAVNVVAFTLVQRPGGPEVYAALRNDGDISACDAAISFEFFDHTEQSVGAWIGGVYAAQLYRRSDETGGLVACIEPGATAMVALLDLPESLALDELAATLYQLTYFDRDILPFELVAVDAFAVSGVETVNQGAETAFSGNFRNELEVPVNDAAVTIFPVNEVGRPLGVASSQADDAVPSKGSWEFRTTTVAEPGTDYVAFPSGSVSF